MRIQVVLIHIFMIVAYTTTGFDSPVKRKKKKKKKDLEKERESSDDEQPSTSKSSNKRIHADGGGLPDPKKVWQDRLIQYFDRFC